MSIRWRRENDFDTLVAASAATYNIPGALIKAVIAQESEFNPRAYRAEPQLPPYNAPGLEHGGDASRGLMQILYRTAYDMGYRGAANDLYDPAVNIHWGTKYLAAIVHEAQRAGYGIDSGISTYNAGPSRDRPGDGKRSTSRKDGRTADGSAMAAFVNQAYVNRVLSNYQYFLQQERGGVVQPSAQAAAQAVAPATASVAGMAGMLGSSMSLGGIAVPVWAGIALLLFVLLTD